MTVARMEDASRAIDILHTSNLYSRHLVLSPGFRPVEVMGFLSWGSTVLSSINLELNGLGIYVNSAFRHYRSLTSLPPMRSQCLPLRRHCHSRRLCSSSSPLFIVVGCHRRRLSSSSVVIVVGCHRRWCSSSSVAIVALVHRCRCSFSLVLILVDVSSSALFTIDSVHLRVVNVQCPRRCSNSLSFIFNDVHLQ